MYDNELTLIGKETDYDAIGNPIVKETRTDILCDLLSVGRSEFYAAGNDGYKPEHVFKIHTFEYNNERLVEFKGEIYSIIRTYGVDEEIELTCEKDVGNG